MEIRSTPPKKPKTRPSSKKRGQIVIFESMVRELSLLNSTLDTDARRAFATSAIPTGVQRHTAEKIILKYLPLAEGQQRASLAAPAADTRRPQRVADIPMIPIPKSFPSHVKKYFCDNYKPLCARFPNTTPSIVQCRVLSVILEGMAMNISEADVFKHIAAADMTGSPTPHSILDNIKRAMEASKTPSPDADAPSPGGGVGDLTPATSDADNNKTPASDTQTVQSSAQPPAKATGKRPASSSRKGKGRRYTRRKTGYS